jgi:outer membrane immunogenic protein
LRLTQSLDDKTDRLGVDQTKGRGNMKTLKWIALAALVSAAPTMAADYETNSAFSWTGLYAGVDLGYGFSSDGHLTDSYCDAVTPGRCVESDTTSPNFGKLGTWVSKPKMTDFIGGAHVGFNHQFDGGFVLGSEMDLGLGGSGKGSFTYGGNFNPPNDPDNDAVGKLELGLTGSARVRAGYAVDRFLPYLTGGIAYASYKASYVQPDESTAPRSGKGSFLGWTLGGGLDYAVTENIVIGAEYRYTKFGTDNLGLTNPALDADSYQYKADLKTHDIRIRASLKF